MSPKYSVTCTCGKEIPVQASQAGQNLTCECGQAVSVPKLRELRLLSNPFGSTSVVGAEKVSARGWHVGYGSIAALSLAVALGTFLTTGYYLVNRLMINDSVTIEDEIRAGNVMIDQFSNAELIELYYDINQAGLGQRSTPPSWYLDKLWAEYFENKAIQYGIGFAASLGIGLFFLWISTNARRKGRA